MIFSEPFFLFFFLPICLAIHFVTRKRARNVALAVASLIFYAVGESRFVAWLLASIAVSYWIGRGIEQTRGKPLAKRLLVIGIASDLSLLVVFKYGGFLTKGLDGVLRLVHIPLLPVPHLLLPLAISFLTLKNVSYKVDVYRGDAGARRALDLALYILLFPQLIAGPIVRYREIAAELVDRVYRRTDFAEAVRRFVTGLGKKLIVADTAGLCVDRVFAVPTGEITTGLAWLGVVCYTVQIYFDFSGYTDMAIGLARMFGFHLPENFNYPYISASITEFWRRWHMSLTRWLRDYLYIPLGGNRRGPARTYVNLAIVFFLCGLWHGASWVFVVWGLFHGALLVAERLLGLGRMLERMWRPLRHIYAMLMIMVGWALFRSHTVAQAWALLIAMAGFAPAASSTLSVADFVNPELALALIVGALGSMPLIPAWQKAMARVRDPLPARVVTAFDAAAGVASVVGFASVFLYSSMLAMAGTYGPFIYLRF